LVSIKKFPAMEQLLKAALARDLEDLPAFLWRQNPQADHREEKLINILMFVLTNFADNCCKIVLNTKPKK
jgi:hypothetical protein